MGWINPDYECRKNLIENAIEDIETYLQEMENNCTEWEINYDYLKLVRDSFNTFKETF